jgi:UDP-N-acetyl-D-mannosaminuronic acid dehydrogenase
MSALEEVSGLKAGVDFDLAYSSERIAEGRAYEEFRTMPLVVGGINTRSLERAAEVLGAINTKPVFKASSIELVEAAKMFENAQRDVNIAVANQVARFANRFDIPAWELIDACNTHTRVKILAPGIGVGGPCLPYASPYLFGSLSDPAERDELLPTFVSAREANAAQPAYIAGRMAQALHGTSGRRGLFGGIAMKDNSDDVTVSPAAVLARTLKDMGSVVHVLDDIAEVPPGFDRETDLRGAAAWAEAIVLPIRQSGVNYDTLRELLLETPGRLCVCDFRGIFRDDPDFAGQPWYMRL